jgi:hypothetical protein
MRCEAFVCLANARDLAQGFCIYCGRWLTFELTGKYRDAKHAGICPVERMVRRRARQPVSVTLGAENLPLRFRLA